MSATSEFQLSEREIKALQIAATSKLTRKGNMWLVPSQAGHGEYKVNPDPQAPNCTCPDFEFRQARCKHVIAVEYVLRREQTPDGRTVVTETVKVTRQTYTQDWKSYNRAQQHEKSELQAYLYELCKNLPEPEQRTGRPRLALADIIFSSVFKIYSTVSGRRFSSDLREAKA
ncbi:MAG TPA: SWIM zinc finger family protein, partial [Pyrinomonadaceae bacterium]|nr:SWIM zinc finger family protein [Pyrinomonadaceae bacterium]